MMKYAIIEDGKVSNIVVSKQALQTNWVEITGTVGIGYLFDGQTFSEPPPVVKTPEEIQAEVVNATQKRLDAWAKERNYDGILSACTYAASTNQVFAAEGQRAVQLRDETWQTLYNILGQVATQGRVVTGYADIEGDLPVLAWA